MKMVKNNEIKKKESNKLRKKERKKERKKVRKKEKRKKKNTHNVPFSFFLLSKKNEKRNSWKTRLILNVYISYYIFE